VNRPRRTLKSVAEAEDRFSTGPTVTAEALHYLAAAAEQNQPKSKWGTKQLEAEIAAAGHGQS
jgi:hypothetical protein